MASRVLEIQKGPVETWHYVPKDENPAECATKHISASELSSSSLWWNGPAWLAQFPFPAFSPQEEVQSAEEERRVQTSPTVRPEPGLLSKYSNLRKLERVTSYLFRFLRNSQRRFPKTSGELTSGELEASLFYWIRQAQAEHFSQELIDLEESAEVSRTSRLVMLNPYRDPGGVLRVGACRRDVKAENPHPIILPHGHLLTKLIINYCHVTHDHADFQILWSMLQEKYYILRIRDTIRHEVWKCLLCRRRRSETMQRLMRSLPMSNLNNVRPFQTCGVDNAGPFVTRANKARTSKTFDSYFSMFVCLATKAVHLEAVGDPTTDSFLGALDRFTALRGTPNQMYCCSSFTDSDIELKEMLVQHLAEKGTMWDSVANHHGGFWETGVKSAKVHLKRVVGNNTLTYEEFKTVLARVETCLNSRPLCAMSGDPMDYTVLTPGHFLRCNYPPPTPSPRPLPSTLPQPRLSRCQLTEQLLQHFWRRWSSDYLSSLQQIIMGSVKRAEKLQV